MSQRRGRSVLLNLEIVRSIAKSKKIMSPTALNYAILEARGHIDGPSTKAGDRAWNGIPISRECANEVAQALGVNNHHDLQTRAGMSLWSQLRMDESKSAEIIEVKVIQRRSLILYEEETSDNDLKIAVDGPWQLKLTLEDEKRPNYHILALIRNEEKHEVIVPSTRDFPTYFKEKTVFIPPVNKKPFYFDESEGLGWREIIVIACRDDIFPVLQRTDDSCLDASTRDKIAALLMSESRSAHYVFDSIRFDLIQG